MQVPLDCALPRGPREQNGVMKRPYWLLEKVWCVYIVGRGTCEYPIRYFCNFCNSQLRNYLQVPLSLCITKGQGKVLVRFYRREGYLRIPTSIFLQVLYFQLRNYMQVLLCYNSRQIKLLTLSKSCQLEAGGYKHL